MVDVRDLHDLTSSWCTKSSRGETNERYIIVESFFFSSSLLFLLLFNRASNLSNR